MRSFSDRDGKSWSIQIVPAVVRTLRSEFDLDLVSLDPKVFDRLYEDELLLHETLWRLCEKQAIERDIDVEAFALAVAGDPVDAAYEAILGSITDFSRGRKRSRLKKAIDLTAVMRAKEDKLVMTRLEDPALVAQLEEAMETRMEASLQNALTRLSSATNSPDSSE